MVFWKQQKDLLIFLTYNQLRIFEIIKEKFGWNGEFELDTSRPDGVHEKKVDGNLGQIKLDWKPETNLNDGIQQTVDWYIKHYG